MDEVNGDHQLGVGKWQGCPVTALDAEGIFVSFWFAKLGTPDRAAIVSEIARRKMRRAALRARKRERKPNGLPET